MKTYVNEGFYNRSEAEKWVDAYYRAYSTEGYGTDIRIFPAEFDLQQAAGIKWIACGYRFNNAD